MTLTSIEIALRQAENCLRSRRVAEARRIISEVRAQDPHHPKAILLEGIVANLAGDHDLAVALLRPYLSRQPGDIGGWVNLGNAYRGAGQLSEAADALRKAARLQPDAAVIHLNLGTVLSQAGDHGGAVEALRRAAALQPDSADIAVVLSRALAFLGMVGEAIAVADAQIAAGHGSPPLVQWRDALESGPLFPNLQGSHAPERQVYMSAAVHLLGAIDRPVSILEIGTFMGASMVTWARAIERFAGGIGEICCLDPWEGADASQYGTAMSADLQGGTAHRVFRNAARFVPAGITVTELRGFSAEILPTLAGRSFDIIYVDGCHLHPEVLQDLEASDRLLAEGGFMCGDDLELQLHETDSAWVEANGRSDFPADPATGRGFHPGVTLGVGTFFGPVSAFNGFWIMQKTAEGYRPVRMQGARGLLPYHWPKDFVDLARAAVLKDELLDEVL